MTDKPKAPCLNTIITGTCSFPGKCPYSHNEDDLYAGHASQQLALNNSKYGSRLTQNNTKPENIAVAATNKDIYDYLQKELLEKRNIQVNLEIQTSANDFSISYIEQRIAQIQGRNTPVSIDVVSSSAKVEVHLIRMYFFFMDNLI
jgi:hypothetical protein